MKAAANGALNLSTLRRLVGRDLAQSGPTHSHRLGHRKNYQDPKYQEQVEAEALYELLERDVIPTFYDRGPDGVPRRWIEYMKSSIGTICPFVNTHRMVKDYACQVYLKAHEQYRALETDGASRAKALAAWIARLRQEWRHVRIEAVEQAPDATLAVGTEVQVRTRVQLGSISPEDVAVEFYLGRLNPAGDFINAISAPMSRSEKTAGAIICLRQLPHALGAASRLHLPCSAASPRSQRPLPFWPHLLGRRRTIRQITHMTNGKLGGRAPPGIGPVRHSRQRS